MSKRGFTLIELLIVIAIIAILALIAIPNFIEAQTRSKVSRVMADMRSTGTAIEAYAVDWSRYPCYFNPLDYDDATGETKPYLTYVPVNLTTPIAFLTSVLLDPFRDVAATANPTRPFIYRHAMVETAELDNFGDDTPNEEFQRDQLYGAAREYFSNGAGERQNNWGWFLACPGPDQQPEILNAVTFTGTFGGPYTAATPSPQPRQYDPTNGTVSLGEIMRWGP